MYAIIYTEIIDEKEETITSVENIINGNINPNNWNFPEQTTLRYQNCTDESDLITKATALDPNWENEFEKFYLKK